MGAYLSDDVSSLPILNLYKIDDDNFCRFIQRFPHLIHDGIKKTAFNNNKKLFISNQFNQQSSI